jgi:hypothetical protein
MVAIPAQSPVLEDNRQAPFAAVLAQVTAARAERFAIDPKTEMRADDDSVLAQEVGKHAQPPATEGIGR